MDWGLSCRIKLRSRNSKSRLLASLNIYYTTDSGERCDPSNPLRASLFNSVPFCQALVSLCHLSPSDLAIFAQMTTITRSQVKQFSLFGIFVRGLIKLSIKDPLLNTHWYTVKTIKGYDCWTIDWDLLKAKANNAADLSKVLTLVTIDK
jgi:hypothetical protein